MDETNAKALEERELTTTSPPYLRAEYFSRPILKRTFFSVEEYPPVGWAGLEPMVEAEVEKITKVPPTQEPRTLQKQRALNKGLP